MICTDFETECHFALFVTCSLINYAHTQPEKRCVSLIEYHQISLYYFKTEIKLTLICENIAYAMHTHGSSKLYHVTLVEHGIVSFAII